MTRAAVLLPPVAAMTLIVVASNILVQYPVHARLGPLQLADILTFGAFTYPFAFLVTDLTNRRWGPRVARRVVFAGFAVAVAGSLAIPPMLFDLGLLDSSAAADRLFRIATASGVAFLAAQLLDIAVFDRLRRKSWWRAPMLSSVAGSLLDTATFFMLAFAPTFFWLGPDDGYALQAAPLFGVLAAEPARWISWALGDLAVKLSIAAAALIPYRIVMQSLMPAPDAART